MNLLWSSSIDTHHVGDENEGSVLRSKSLSEQPEIFETCVALNKIVLQHRGWYQHSLNGTQDFHTDTHDVRLWKTRVKCCPQLFNSVDERLVSILAITATEVLVDLLQSIAENTEQREKSFFTTTVTGSWELDTKYVFTSIMTSDSQSLITSICTPYQVNCWQKSFNLNKVSVVVFVQKVLTWNFDLFKLLMVEFTQVWTQVLQVDLSESSIQLVFKSVSPFSQLSDIGLQVRLADHKILFEFSSDLFWKNCFCKSGDIGFSYRRQLGIVSWITKSVKILHTIIQ